MKPSVRYIIALAFLSISLNINAQIIDNFQLKGTDNLLHSFEELKGEKLTVIDFWTTWCKPCMKAMPELSKIYEEFKEKGVQFIGINCDGPRNVAKVEPLIRSLQIKYPVLLDIDTEIMSDLNFNSFPTLIVVNKGNKIVWIHEGFILGDALHIKTKIENLLNETN